MKIVVRAEDLKNGFDFVVSFEEFDDMVSFLSRYNPVSIHIEHMSIYYDD